MTLLQPWAAAVAGGVGLVFLSLLYVLKLRRRVVRVGSTLLWEQALAEVEVNTPWRRFRPDWLFLVQALAIACLALAIGRPAIGMNASQRRVVVVIDRSASMGAVDRDSEGEGTRLERAKKLATEMVENLRARVSLRRRSYRSGARAAWSRDSHGRRRHRSTASRA
ncbi:MAG: BatA and WFA domain-containing protein [Phycisphaerales bacterium]